MFYNDDNALPTLSGADVVLVNQTSEDGNVVMNYSVPAAQFAQFFLRDLQTFQSNASTEVINSSALAQESGDFLKKLNFDEDDFSIYETMDVLANVAKKDESIHIAKAMMDKITFVLLKYIALGHNSLVRDAENIFSAVGERMSELHTDGVEEESLMALAPTEIGATATNVMAKIRLALEEVLPKVIAEAKEHMHPSIHKNVTFILDTVSNYILSKVHEFSLDVSTCTSEQEMEILPIKYFISDVDKKFGLVLKHASDAEKKLVVTNTAFILNQLYVGISNKTTKMPAGINLPFTIDTENIYLTINLLWNAPNFKKLRQKVELQNRMECSARLLQNVWRTQERNPSTKPDASDNCALRSLK